MDLVAASHFLVGGIVGGGLGYAYHKVIGCRSGVCPITANPYTSILYGALMGFAMVRG